MKKYIVGFVLLSVAVLSCKKEKSETPDEDPGNKVIQLTIPKGFPYPNIPDDNQPTPNRIELGRKLFFDPILSRDSTVSCGSCHQTAKFFTDNLQVSVGVDNLTGTRNAPTILNTAYHPSFFWDGGVPTLEMQVTAPIANPVEMDLNIHDAVQRLVNHPEYPALFEEAYGEGPSVYTLTRAIANFERTLISASSKFDDYQQNGNTSALNASELNGKNIFFGERGECFHCHGTYNFTDNSFQNNGLYLNYADSGRAAITTNASDVGKFKVPSLRNIEMTSPYMHDGSLATLEDVVEHYNTGGHPHPNKSFLIQPLNLSQQEKQDLVNFLKALTDR